MFSDIHCPRCVSRIVKVEVVRERRVYLPYTSTQDPDSVMLDLPISEQLSVPESHFECETCGWELHNVSDDELVGRLRELRQSASPERSTIAA